tara:strand:+ start:1105 stop:1893 length:789 start_codon:yes stop_codon:yes gene_type:complete
MDIKINIEHHQPLVISLVESNTAKLYTEILSKNLARENFVFRDPVNYTPEYFHSLCLRVKEELGWDWIRDDHSIDQTTNMHKNIENTLEKTESFRNIPGDQQNLIHEAHFCIHQMQYSKQGRTPFIQIEWFNDDYEDLPADAEFTFAPEFGDLILQNPYVGHPPLQCWQQNDYKNIDRTCQFHDIIKPGIKINTTDVKLELDLDMYKSWWINKCSDYVQKVGWENILKYTGFPKIGEVIDKDNLRRIVLDSKPLNIKKIELL